jgi:hypothetical protein
MAFPTAKPIMPIKAQGSKPYATVSVMMHRNSLVGKHHGGF